MKYGMNINQKTMGTFFVSSIFTGYSTRILKAQDLATSFFHGFWGPKASNMLVLPWGYPRGNSLQTRVCVMRQYIRVWERKNPYKNRRKIAMGQN